MRSEETCCGRSGVGRLACRCAVQWEKVCGKRTGLPGNRAARVLICFYRNHLVALHGFIKKTRGTPDDDLALSHKRQKELER